MDIPPVGSGREGRSPIRQLLAVVALATFLVGGVPTAWAGETSDPYAADPLGLVAHYDLTTELGTTPDVFEVWICQITGGPYDLSLLTPETFVPFLQDFVSAYWSKASAGAYQVSFVVGGLFVTRTGLHFGSERTIHWERKGCADRRGRHPLPGRGSRPRSIRDWMF